MATGMHMDERIVDCLVLGHHDHDRKVSAKSVTMRGTTFQVVTENCSYCVLFIRRTFLIFFKIWERMERVLRIRYELLRTLRMRYV